VRLVLRSDVNGLGRTGDVVEVTKGYARNFLLPKGYAIASTPGVEAQAEGMRKARVLRSAQEKTEAEQLAKILLAASVRITAKAGRAGKLFGSVGSADVSQAIAAQTGASIDRRKIVIEPIKSVGPHDVVLHLHSDVTTTITVEVVAS
jgi:large subunit ribosomal protein L9